MSWHLSTLRSDPKVNKYQVMRQKRMKLMRQKVKIMKLMLMILKKT